MRLESALLTINIVRTIHFYSDCPGGLGCTVGPPAFGGFSCSFPSAPAYSCYALDAWPNWSAARLDADRDNDLDLRDYQALQNGAFAP